MRVMWPGSRWLLDVVGGGEEKWWSSDPDHFKLDFDGENGEDGANLEDGWNDKLVGDGRDGQGVEDYESGKVGRDGHYKKMGKEKKEMAPLW